MKSLLKKLNPVADLLLFIGFFICADHIWSAYTSKSAGATSRSIAAWCFGLVACIVTEIWLMARHIKAHPKDASHGGIF